MNEIQKKIEKINQKITNITQEFKLNSQKVKLLIVSKNRSINDIQKTNLCGQNSFGENYVQESLPKIKKLNNNIKWHFIGQIQSNKARIIAKNFTWCHTITNEKTAILLNKHRPITLPKLNVLIQINLREKLLNVKTNITNLKKLAKIIHNLKNLNLRGIMGMPYQKYTYSEQIETYKYMNLYFKYLKKRYSSVDTLSIGTSHDIKAAIFSGSTLLRIGSLIFHV